MKETKVCVNLLIYDYNNYNYDDDDSNDCDHGDYNHHHDHVNYKRDPPSSINSSLDLH